MYGVYVGVMTRRNVWFPDELWLKAVEESVRRTLEEGRRVSVSEVVRDLVARGLEA